MDFDPTGDQAAIRDSVRGFARAEVAPGYLARAKSDVSPWEAAPADRRGRCVRAARRFRPHSTVHRGLRRAAGLAVEELAYADFNLANAAIPVMLMSSLIDRHAGPEVRERWLRPLVVGEVYVALGLTEPDTGSDVTAIRTTAIADGDGNVISGEKTSVTMLAPRRGDRAHREDGAQRRPRRGLDVPRAPGRAGHPDLAHRGHRMAADGPRRPAPRRRACVGVRADGA